MADWTIYSKDQCPYCDKAKFALKDHDIEVKNISENVDFFKELMERNPNARTMPQIFIDDKHVGGYDQLEKFLGEQNAE